MSPIKIAFDHAWMLVRNPLFWLTIPCAAVPVYTIAMAGTSDKIPAPAGEPGVLGLAFVLIVIPLMLYMLPFLVALMRGHQSKGGIFVLNLFFGWTILGWFGSLIWAMSAVTRPISIVIDQRLGQPWQTNPNSFAPRSVLPYANANYTDV